MERGDISNEFAPTIAIDVDGLIIFNESRFFGFIQHEELNLSAYKVCEHHILKGRMIYLLAHRNIEAEVKDIEAILDHHDFPYNKLYFVPDDKSRELILDRKHVHMYYYMDPLHGATRNKRKEQQVFNIAETYF